VEITWIKNPEIRAQARAMLEISHMTVCYGAQPLLLSTGCNLNDLDEAGRQKAVALVKTGIDEAYEMGAASLAFLSGRYEEVRKEEAYRALVASTLELSAYAKARGALRLSLEIFDHAIDKRSLIGPAALAVRFSEDIRRAYPEFGLLVDLSHIPLIGEDMEESLRLMKDHLVHAHMGNCVVRTPGSPVYGDNHPRFGFPGGENDVAELARYLRCLLDIGFLSESRRPVVSFEVKPYGDEDSDLVVANAKRTLDEAWARLPMNERNVR
jgi:sugar phosphate isomerase/epimerase